MKRKLNWLGHGSTNSLAESLLANSALTPQVPALLARGVADAGFTWVHLTSGPKTRRCLHVKLLPISLHCDLYVDGVSVSISKSDIIGATLKNSWQFFWDGLKIIIALSTAALRSKI
jgi:hypothetical protein